MTSQHGQQKITTQIWSVKRISEEKCLFFKNYAENEAKRLLPDPFFTKKALNEAKAKGLQLSFYIY